MYGMEISWNQCSINDTIIYIVRWFNELRLYGGLYKDA